jgi:hypothetical protein
MDRPGREARVMVAGPPCSWGTARAARAWCRHGEGTRPAAALLERPALATKSHGLPCRARAPRRRQDDARCAIKSAPAMNRGASRRTGTGQDPFRGIRQGPLPCLICGTLAVARMQQPHGRRQELTMRGGPPRAAADALSFWNPGLESSGLARPSGPVWSAVGRRRRSIQFAVGHQVSM